MAWGLSDAQWEVVTKQRPRRKSNPKGGCPTADDLGCFGGILWIRWTGAPSSELPERYGKRATVHDRLKRSTENGALEAIWRAFLTELNEQEQIRWNECFIDGTFFSAKKGSQSRKDQARQGIEAYGIG